ncbi:MAG: hypothetical protein QOC81_1953 [Thermoanaerobaculia bacterium]|jgi:hypothetical protein|nr:hypothetical protein [Thermoanaerobaculia bacterium]
MTRSFTVVAFLFLAACSTSKPAQPVVIVDPIAVVEPAAVRDVNPGTDPSAIGAIDEAARESREQAAAGARTGRRIGVVAGTLAAILGGPHHDSVEGMVGRYVITRDLATATGAIIGGVKGGKEGAKRGFELDLQFAELKKIDGLDVTRPTPDRIDVYTKTVPGHETLAAIAAVFNGREQRSIDIEAADPIPLDLRDAFIDLGVPAANISVQRNDDLEGAVIRIRYLY